MSWTLAVWATIFFMAFFAGFRAALDNSLPGMVVCSGTMVATAVIVADGLGIPIL